MIILGKCHCANISFRFAWEPDPVEIPARVCGCSFCLKHGGVWTSNPTASLEVEVQDRKFLSLYKFGTATAEFNICAQCGVVPVVTCLTDGRLYAVVSVNTFENVDPSILRRTAASFDGEGVGSRLARRKQNWIADVRFC